MPPETASIPLPLTRGEDALAYLRHCGLDPRIPPSLRSSDYASALSNPYLYFLVRRLGLVPALSWSKAKNQGSWFHHLFAMFDNPDRFVIYNSMLDTRIVELKRMCKELSLGPDETAGILERERIDAARARAWFEATEYVPIPRENAAPITFQQWLRDERWSVVGRELRYSYIHPEFPLVPIVITMDLLLYSASSNSLWVIDAKTTRRYPDLRLSTIAHEFQTQQYMVTVRHRLADLCRNLSLPLDCKFGGMVHPCIWKPQIVFGQKDRDFRWVADGKRKKQIGRLVVAPDRQQWTAEWGDPGCAPSFKVAGSFEKCFKALWAGCGKKPEKVFCGEPRLGNYVDRLAECYRGEGEYSGDAESRAAHPPVNMSTTTAWRLLDERWLTEYWDRVDLVYQWATCDPIPGAFPRNTDDLFRYDDLSLYADFFLNEVEHYPEIIAKKHFMVAHRDEDITPLEQED